MTCSSCVNSIERTLNKIPKVSASVNFAAETVHVMAPAGMNPKIIISAIKSAGYTAHALSDTRQAVLQNKKPATALIFAAVFTLPLLAISMIMSLHPTIDSWVETLIANLNLNLHLKSPWAWVVLLLSDR